MGHKLEGNRRLRAPPEQPLTGKNVKGRGLRAGTWSATELGGGIVLRIEDGANHETWVDVTLTRGDVQNMLAVLDAATATEET